MSSALRGVTAALVAAVIVTSVTVPAPVRAAAQIATTTSVWFVPSPPFFTSGTAQFGSTVPIGVMLCVTTQDATPVPVPVGSVQLVVPPLAPSPPVALDPSGCANVSFSVLGIPLGNDPVYAIYSDLSGVYADSQGQAQLTIEPAQVFLMLEVFPSPVAVGDTTTIYAELRRVDDGRPLSSTGTVLFRVTDPEGVLIIDDAPDGGTPVNLGGVADRAFLAAKAGTYLIHAEWSDLPNYVPAANDGTVLAVASQPSAIAVADASGVVGGFVYVTATVTSNGSPVTAGSVQFAVTGVSGTTAPLNASGVAKGVVLLDSAVAGTTYTVTATYNNYPSYTSSQGTATLSVYTGEFVSGNVAPGGTLTTDVSNTGATPTDTVQTSVTTPAGGVVTIAEEDAAPPPSSGYTFLAKTVVIAADPATVASPLVIVFTIDASIVPGGVTAATLQLFRNGVLVPACTGAPQAIPDPCISLRETLGDADIRITVRTSEASRWTLGVAVALLNQTITFGPLANRTMAKSPVTVSATASSGLAVTFTTTTPLVCTAGGPNGATITLVGPGTCTVKADQPGNAVYNPAPTISRNFKVTKLNQTITFGSLANKKVAQSPVTVNATASSGLAVTFTTTTPSVCTAGGTNGTTITLVGPGTCTVKADQAGNPVYNPAPSVTQSFRVTK